MKASLKFRDEEKPLLRAKIPISVLGLPLSGASAGEAKDLRLDVATAFVSGPSFRVSYRPNDSWCPFALVVKTGIGALGSPFSSPMTMSAEFNIVGRGGPSFTIQLKPRFGDFCLKKTTRAAAAASLPFVPGSTSGVVLAPTARALATVQIPWREVSSGKRSVHLDEALRDVDIDPRPRRRRYPRLGLRSRADGRERPPAVEPHGGEVSLGTAHAVRSPLILRQRLRIHQPHRQVLPPQASHTGDEQDLHRTHLRRGQVPGEALRRRGSELLRAGAAGVPASGERSLRKAVEELRADIFARRPDPVTPAAVSGTTTSRPEIRERRAWKPTEPPPDRRSSPGTATTPAGKVRGRRRPRRPRRT
ncbi:unnamed protein product [Spirodela intermedia]|uniref:Uncharacterized protein n=1 Tax=Spirodela intermedia TaxID=51605 RepID=A0A7I8JL66_SPIIN|nr:unnamed protein product [Spirodela intermedia]CAA6670904.1 unnamed protein product [Spirodela intermedia]